MTKFLITHWRVVIIAALVAACYLLFKWGNYQRVRADNATEGRNAAIADYQNINTKYMNAQGDLVTTSKAFELSKSEFKKAIENRDLTWVKKFTQYKNATSVQSFTSMFAPEEKIKVDTVWIVVRDSIKAWQYSYQDEYNNINALVIDTPRFQQRDKYFVAITRSRPKFWFWKLQWSKWEYNGQVTNSNKLIKADSLQTVIVR